MQVSLKHLSVKETKSVDVFVRTYGEVFEIEGCKLGNVWILFEKKENRLGVEPDCVDWLQRRSLYVTIIGHVPLINDSYK